MKYPIAFIDTEIEPKSRQILDIGGVRSDGCEFHKNLFGVRIVSQRHPIRLWA